MIIVKFHNHFCFHYVILNPARLEEKQVYIEMKVDAKTCHFLLRIAWKVKLVLTVDCRIKVRLDLQAGKSLVVVKGPFFP
jgi:hypothetical protein